VELGALRYLFFFAMDYGPRITDCGRNTKKGENELALIFSIHGKHSVALCLLLAVFSFLVFGFLA